MKNIQYILFLLFIFIVVSCSKNEEDEKKDDLNLTTDFLNQSIWKGDIIFSSDNYYEKNLITIAFMSDSTGYCTIYKIYVNKPIYTDDINYRIDQKIIYIQGVHLSGDTNGDWFVLYKSQDSLSLVKNLDLAYTTGYMNLKRVY